MPGSRRVLVTGAASGIGLETALALARSGDRVVVADRDVEGGEAAVARIALAEGRAEFRSLDLADLSAIRAFAADELGRGEALDVLVDNAGLLPPMERATTRDGFELEFGVAHLGHGRVEPSARALDQDAAAWLWEASERLTGVRYEMS